MTKQSVNSAIVNTMKFDFELGFKMLFIEYYAPMSRVAKRIIKEPFVEDIVQDVFLGIWNKHTIFESENTLKSYLYNAVENRCISHLRKNSSQNKYINNSDLPTYYEAVLDEDVYSLLMDAVEELPENYKAVIKYTLDGEQLKNIATYLNTTEDAVKAYKKRAKIILSKKIGNLYLLHMFLP